MIVYTVLFAVINLVQSTYNTQELALLFGNKGCIEASLIEITNENSKNVLLEKGSLDKFISYPSVINTTEKATEDKNILSTLNELAQLNEITYQYELLSEEGPAHNQLFKIVLKLGEERYEASGTSLKKAKQTAASLALKNTKFQLPPTSLQKQVEEKIITPTVVLNNVALKLGISVSYFLVSDKDRDITNYKENGKVGRSYYEKLNDSIYDSQSILNVPTGDGPVTGPFSVKVQVGDLSFLGLAHTIQAARHDAAVRALKDLEKQALLKDNVCSSDESAELCKQKRESLKSPISRVYEAGQNHNLNVEFNVVSEGGKPNKKIFVTECKLGKFKTDGEGKSKKDSKRAAAQKMMEYLQFLPETYNENVIVEGIKGKTKKKKNKKNKMLKNVNEKAGQSIGDMINSMWASVEGNHEQNPIETDHSEGNDMINNERKAPDSKSPKDTILEISNLLNVEIQFSDLKQIDDKFYSLMSVAVQPLHICLGKDLSQEMSQNRAASHGLKLLYKSGLLDNIKYKTYKEDIRLWVQEISSDHASRDLYHVDERDDS